MFRFISRMLGLWVIAGGFVAAVVDGMRSIAASTPVITSAAAAWSELAPSSLGALRGAMEGRVGAEAWSTVTATVLALPAWALLGAIGFALLAAGRRKAPPIGVIP
ncbi:MAG: hypothetical protein OEL76_05105 [Siculibacillus sp.]|nr:hypothetical protein [Siculibacillus sp.]